MASTIMASLPAAQQGSAAAASAGTQGQAELRDTLGQQGDQSAYLEALTRDLQRAYRSNDVAEARRLEGKIKALSANQRALEKAMPSNPHRHSTLRHSPSDEHWSSQKFAHLEYAVSHDRAAAEEANKVFLARKKMSAANEFPAPSMPPASPIRVQQKAPARRDSARPLFSNEGLLGQRTLGTSLDGPVGPADLRGGGAYDNGFCATRGCAAREFFIQQNGAIFFHQYIKFLCVA